MSKVQILSHKKNGKWKGKQRYKCLNCDYVFENKRRIRTDISQSLWYQYVYEKQTYDSLARHFNLSRRTIQRKIDQFQIVLPTVRSGDTVIVMDTSYFGRDFGVMVFRDHYRKKNIFWKYLRYETISEYKSGIEYLESIGWNILGIVCDGRRGIFSSFGNIPLQMCQRHQVAIIRRYITQNPRLEAGKEMREISLLLTKSGKKEFIIMLDQWYQKWRLFLMEKTYNDEKGRWYYTHRRLRSAYRSLKSNIPYLFTYLEYPDLDITNTTNSIEGSFSNLKTKLRVHAGIKKKRKINLIDELLGK